MNKKAKQDKQQQPWAEVLTVAGVLAATCVLLSTLRLAQDIRMYDMAGSPGIYPVIGVTIVASALVLGRSKPRLVLVNAIILAVILASTIFWLFGLTNAGSDLRSEGMDAHSQYFCSNSATDVDCRGE